MNHHQWVQNRNQRKWDKVLIRHSFQAVMIAVVEYENQYKW